MHDLETPRLRLRPLTPDDLDWLVALHADPEVARYLGDGEPRSVEVTTNWLGRALAAYDDGLGHLAVERRSDGEVLGRAGLWRFLVERGAAPPRVWWGHEDESVILGKPPERIDLATVVEVGYTLRRAHWGQGYATEAATAVRDDAFARLETPSVSSFIFPANAGSIRVAEKIGMRRIAEVLFGEIPALRYRIERDEWTARSNSPGAGLV